MHHHYHLLFTIYEIVKDQPHPLEYSCRPRELILRQFQDWPAIQEHLKLLEEEELITTEQQNTLVIRITRAGMEKMIERDKIANN